MVQSVTIVPPARPGNRVAGRCLAGFVALGVLLAVGCAAPRIVTFQWDLATPVETRADRGWRARLAGRDEVPGEFRTVLCDEFELVVADSPGKWRRLREALELEEGPTTGYPDFRNGVVVGLIADVGEPAAADWPVALDAVRRDGTHAWIRYRFSGGLYYPVRTGPYFIAGFIPDIRDVRIVQINRRVFALSDR
jgi:hypothetical protein